MTKTGNDRHDPQYWEDRRLSYQDHAKAQLDAYACFSRWFDGDLSDLANAVSSNYRTRGLAVSNFINLVTRVSCAELMFRAPRFLVEPVMSFGPSVFTPDLARVETHLLNDWVDEADLYGEGRRAIIDGLLGPSMIIKLGYSAEIAVDTDLVDQQRAMAKAEGVAILSGRKPKVRADDYHRGHIEEHEQTLALIERGDVEAPRGVIAYLKKHMQKHEEALADAGERVMETIRHEAIFNRRRSPLRVSWDPYASCAMERGWYTEVFVKPVTQVHNDPRYDPSVRGKVEAADYTQVDGAEGDKDRYEAAGVKNPEDMAVLFETVDLDGNEVITYDPALEKPLRVRPYKLQRILPGGPYITASFAMSPLTDMGVPPPMAYRGNQETLALLDTIASTVARRQVPKMIAKGGMLSAKDLDRILNGLPAALIQLKDMGATDDINKIIQQVPMPEPSDFLMNFKAMQERAIERYSGLGSARAGGGDHSRTATASAIIQESTSNLSEDLASVLDDFLSRVGRGALRLIRRFYKPEKVAEVVGDGALEIWPQSWAERDIARDKGVMMVPGSNRRKNTAVEQKLLTELYALMTKDPAIPPETRIEVLRRVLDASGVFGVDLTGMQRQLALQRMQELAGGGGGGPEEVGGGGAPAGPGGPPDRADQGPAARAGRRGRSRGEGSRSGQQQGARNVGGGRVGTGASRGDNKRMMR